MQISTRGAKGGGAGAILWLVKEAAGSDFVCLSDMPRRVSSRSAKKVMLLFGFVRRANRIFASPWEKVGGWGRDGNERRNHAKRVTLSPKLGRGKEVRKDVESRDLTV